VKAVLFHEHGGPEVLALEEVPEPDPPGPGEVRVAVAAVALNHLDLWVRRGLPLRIEMPHVGGSDFAGVVDALGAGVTGLAAGDRVVGWPVLGAGPDGALPRGRFAILGEEKNGACCERLVLPAQNLLPLPAGVAFETAAALPVVFTTAWTMLVERGRLARGETLLVQGASSGVGTAAIQLGKLLGARVIAATRGPEQGARARALGADEVIDAARERIHLRVHQLTGRAGADVVFEHVGPATWDESVRSAAYQGRLVTCGGTTGASAPTHLPFLFGKRLEIHGITLGSKQALARVLTLVAEGQLRPVLDRVLPLADCRRGHELLESGAVFGKLVLRVPA
jgi:NADPH:quinone reductase-like Zn-dependent oxidoreductase